VRLTCDILDESFYKPIIVAPTNPSYSTTTSTSPLRDGFICDASLMVKNETLKKEVNDLTCVLGNAYGGDARLLKYLGSQRFSHNKEGLGYTLKKGKVVFVTLKASFVMGNGQLSNIARLTRTSNLMYPQLDLILVTCLLRVPMV
jgi:hypothetical protein